MSIKKPQPKLEGIIKPEPLPVPAELKFNDNGINNASSINQPKYIKVIYEKDKVIDYIKITNNGGTMISTEDIDGHIGYHIEPLPSGYGIDYCRFGGYESNSVEFMHVAMKAIRYLRGIIDGSMVDKYIKEK